MHTKLIRLGRSTVPYSNLLIKLVYSIFALSNPLQVTCVHIPIYETTGGSTQCSHSSARKVQWNLTYPNLKYLAARIIQLQSLCILFNAHAWCAQSKDRLKGGVTTRGCRNFDRLKPEETKI